jgi:hypothetical protein
MRRSIYGNIADDTLKRGGAGNIVDSPRVGPVDGRRSSQEIIPETNIIPAEGHENFHTGVCSKRQHVQRIMLITGQRGGGGNVHKEKYGGHTHDPNKPTLIEKAKDFLTSHHHKDKDGKTVEGTTSDTSTGT